jgi:hypothetical protein
MPKVYVYKIKNVYVTLNNMEFTVCKLKNFKKIHLLFLALFFVIGTSCTTFRIGIQLLLRDFDGNELITNEPQVKNILETMLLTLEDYTMAGYTRKVFSPELKKTSSLYHSFYTITGSEMSFITLSFSGTKKRMKSEGVWVINSDSDIKSYTDFKYGTNEWEVEEISVSNGINTEMTVKNIIYRIENNTNYYFNDHKNSMDGRENCITALQNTLVENY